MEPRDRLGNLGVFAAAALVWILVALLVTSRDPRTDVPAGYVGAVLIGAAVGLTTIPIFWLVVFGRHGRIAYRGDWVRAVRRGSWVAAIVVLFVLLRLEHAFQLPIALFVMTLALVAETTLSVQR